ncbi:methyltransferase domain-containing protein [Bradyrhizobium sp. UNPA324]|uniref:class I SAM-dependent methyltransferase n=1 Tax=Bradyrhizobium sp. UNPA324 TaxID=1141174 RepID=UPI00116EB396|nr:methyltransferase domain-containing protein [Bradyrhizobium sp. UNPA324]TQF33460.1 hypothetical protein UNPA324_30870 [Bradyrhizobium sp. UNPA324]
MPDIQINYHFLDTGKTFEHYANRRSSFQSIYADLLSSEPRLSGKVLDIGCGHAINPTLEKIISKVGTLDGVDPFPLIDPPLHLRNRWTCKLEDVPVERDTYDMAYSYNVVEHVENVESFLAKAIEILAPGAVYWSLSPNAHHPFTWATRLAERLGLKKTYVKNINQKANDYPAYYRLSHDERIVRAITALKLPVSQIDFYFVPNVHWDTYFPRALRIIAHLFDRCWLLRRPKRSFIFMFRLRKRPLLGEVLSENSIEQGKLSSDRANIAHQT